MAFSIPLLGRTLGAAIGSDHNDLMRLWSLHPRYLDAKGLLALWREGLLARKVLLDQTKGYRHHPQLLRFRETSDPVRAIDAYLQAVVEEARTRHYAFDAGKIALVSDNIAPIPVTSGQLEYEFNHLLNKLKTRHPRKANQLANLQQIDTHPLFTVVPGPVAGWEKG